MILGHWLEMRAVSQARGALNALAALLPDTAERVVAQQIQAVPLSELQLDDIVLVRPGTRVPADRNVEHWDVIEDEATQETLTRQLQRCAQRHRRNFREVMRDLLQVAINADGGL